MFSTELTLILRLVGTDTPPPVTPVLETKGTILPSLIMAVLDATFMFPTETAILAGLAGTVLPLTPMLVAERPVFSGLVAGVDGTLVVATELAVLACLVGAVLVLASVVVAVALRVVSAVADGEEDCFFVAGWIGAFVAGAEGVSFYCSSGTVVGGGVAAVVVAEVLLPAEFRAVLDGALVLGAEMASWCCLLTAGLTPVSLPGRCLAGVVLFAYPECSDCLVITMGCDTSVITAEIAVWVCSLVTHLVRCVASVGRA